MFRVSWSKESVCDKIAALSDNERPKCQRAYDWLMSNDRSTYKKFIMDRERTISENQKFNFYDYTKRKGIECALWPSLYPYSDWCDSTLDGGRNKIKLKSLLHD